MTSTQSGRAAEDVAASFLVQKGFDILEQNWRRRSCEIDIVARKDKAMYFVEVKYRFSDSQGTGLDYITAGKLQQMEYAARMWIAENKWDDDYYLSAIEVAGAEFVVTEFIDSLT